MLISYIIPMYNSGAYIARCMQSIINQQLTPPTYYEIVVINDGSIDNGPDIVRKYARIHDNIRLINQANQGVGAARNRGIAEAKGEYIHFLDADDALVESGSAMLFEAVLGKGHKPDIIVFGRHFILQRNRNDNFPPLTSNIYFAGSLGNFIRRYGINPFCTSYFFKTEIIRDLKFNNFKIGEDLRFMLDVYDKMDATVLAFDSKLYMYYCHEESTVHKISKKSVNDLIENYISLYTSICRGKLLKQYNLEERRSLTYQTVNFFAFTRILAAPFSLKETKEILRKCSGVGLFKFEGQQSKFYRLIRWIACHPCLMCGISLLYRHIYIPYLKKG